MKKIYLSSRPSPQIEGGADSPQHSVERLDQIGIKSKRRPSPFVKMGCPKGDSARAKRGPIWLFLAVMLLGGITFSIIQVAQADPAIPNPGHSISAIECDTNLCVNAATSRVGIGTITPNSKLQVYGGVGGSWDSLSTYANSDHSALYAEQLNSAGYAGYFSGRVDIIGTAANLTVGSLSSCLNLKTDASGLLKCNTDTYLTTESDPQVGAITNSKWCTANADGTKIDCTSDEPAGGVTSVSKPTGNSTLTIYPTTGAVVASLNLNNPNTWTGAQTFNANTNFPVSGIWNAYGSVGIGTVSPAYKLDVSGDVRWTGILQGGTVPWARLSSFPPACPVGQSVTAVGASSLTCTTTVTGGDFVPIAGGTMTGELIINNPQGTQLSHNADSVFYVNSYDGLQIRINADGAGAGIFKINNSANATVFSVDNSGSTVIGGGTGKLTVGTVDPVFNIGGSKYATYLPGMTGVKEETTGVIQLTGGEYVIDFKELEEGSDLWVFYRVTDFGENWDKLVVFISGEGVGKVWYRKNTAENKLVIYSENSTSISYRLTAPRFDWQNWLNVSEDGSVQGLTVGEVINDQYNRTPYNNKLYTGQATSTTTQTEEGLFAEFAQKVKELVVNIIRTDDIEIKGKIQLRDQATGEIYCTWIEQGEWVKVKGLCQDK